MVWSKHGFNSASIKVFQAQTACNYKTYKT